MSASISSGALFQQACFSPATLIAEAARLIVAQQAARLPDLSASTVIITTHAAPALKRALVQEAALQGHPTIMLPRIGTLENMAATIQIADPVKVVNDSERVLQVYQALKKQRWFLPAECLRVAHELVNLIDGLTHHMTALPATLQEHSHTLARTYAIGKTNSNLSFEATLTYDIWRTLAQPANGEADRATLYALQLTAWAAHPTGPLYIIGSEALTRREQAFVQAYASQAPALLIDATLTDDSARGNFIAHAFAAAPGGADATSHTSRDSTWLQCSVARDVEEEAHAALSVLKQWLIEGKRNIAIVALDRLTARRLRALAERDAILMQDEIGWPYSTTVSATAIMRWLEARQDGFYHTTLFDLLKSPFIFTDWREQWGRARLQAAIDTLERVARRAGVVAGLTRLHEALTRHAERVTGDDATAASLHDADAIIARLVEADRAFSSQRRTPSGWLKTLRTSLVALGMEAGLTCDLAGHGLLTVLDQLENDVAATSMLLSTSEWLDWLRAELEAARFRDVTIASPIVLTSLEATRLRSFEGVLVIGASASNLPGTPVAGSVFNQSVRHILGLPTHIQQMQSITHDLARLMQRTPVCYINWQSDAAAEPMPPAPWVHALIVEARRQGAEIVQNIKLPISTGVFSQKWLENGANIGVSFKDNSRAPAPAVKSAQLPARISASGYQSLVDCPYQFFARGVLGLREPDAIEETMDKRDFGELVHAILHRFHARFPLVSAVEEATLKAALAEETAAVFKEAMQQNFIARAWLLQWQSAIDAYLEWQRQREAEGWRWQQGETPGAISIPLVLPFATPLTEGTTLTLEGRLDRIDSRPALNESAVKEQAVIDYKARDAATLRKKLKQAGEDVQLPVYAALLSAVHINADGASSTATHATASSAPVVEAAYLSIMRGEVKPVVHAGAAAAGEQAQQRLAVIFEALHRGAGLPAQGVEAVCAHCEARGLCRRDHWDRDAD